MKLVIDNVLLPTGTHTLVIEEGKITQVVAESTDQDQIIQARHSDADSWNAAGLVYLPTLADMHCHLDKHHIGERWIPLEPFQTLESHLAYEKKLLGGLTQTVGERAKVLAEQMIDYGTTRIRTHVDVDPEVGLRNLEAILRVREELCDYMDIEIVAFPQQGLIRSSSEQIVREALALGADLVGGVDPAGLDGDMERSLQMMFDIATAAGKGIDLHLHDGGETGLATLRRFAELTREAGLQHRTAVSHAYCLGEQTESDVQPTLDVLKHAGVTLVSSVPIDRPMPRGSQVLDTDVNFMLGSDNIRDAWSPFGNGDMLQRASRMAERENWVSDDRLLGTYAWVSNGKLTPSVGDPADFMLVRALNAQHALASVPARAAVFKKGRRIR
ncbi:amidohydrolase family protein [Paenibacillus sp. 1781tsa1]|uniref:amidohydrolase family protein n=1 Tax=Paenibacillus sp. 1781tsa1 TaxID=2953810 RepID=UPI00209F80C2|nr:amidohydrolase family protein [Paenibacillus sp. 1781tsa1]MCP1183857.1 amidohydrolase family protein [Paenibacillus sp. 1781tsa1]